MSQEDEPEYVGMVDEFGPVDTRRCIDLMQLQAQRLQREADDFREKARAIDTLAEAARQGVMALKARFEEEQRAKQVPR